MKEVRSSKFEVFPGTSQFFQPSTLIAGVTSPVDLLERTRSFAIRALRLCSHLPPGTEVALIKRQLLRAATSVGANYRASRRARSRREFVAKLSIVEEEADECLYWLDLLATLPVVSFAQLQPLSEEKGL